MRLSRFLLILAVITVLPACECPLAASECPGACTPLRANAFDDAQQCLLASEVVSCVEPDSVLTADVGCAVRRSDGVLFMTPSGSISHRLVTSEAYRGCTGEEFRELQSALTLCE